MSEVVRDGLRLFESRVLEDKAKLTALHDAAKLGFDAIGRGEYLALQSDYEIKILFGKRDDIGKSVCTYHLVSSRKRIDANKHVAKPRHLVLFRVKKNVIEVARLLHDAMDFVQLLV